MEWRQVLQKLNSMEPALAAWIEMARTQAARGRTIPRIAPLTNADPGRFAVQIGYTNGETYRVGDVHCCFPLMSVIKPFLLLFLLAQYGAESVLEWVDVQPADTPFHSLDQLVADRGFPRNPMINSGAITLASKLPGNRASERCAALCDWLNQQAHCNLSLDQEMLAAVRQSNRDANFALLNALVQAGAITDPDLTLDTYEQICCLSGQVSDLAQLGLLLVQPDPIAQQHRQLVNAVMLSCGLYEASSRYAIRIGLPIKSGISGALLAVVPRQGAIACYSPALDPTGNSIAGLAFVEQLAQALGLSLFG